MCLLRGGPPLWRILGFWLILLMMGAHGCASEPDTLGDLEEPLTEDGSSYSEDDENAFSNENEEEGANNLAVSNPAEADADSVDLLGDGAENNYQNQGYYNNEDLGEGNEAGYNENNPYSGDNAYSEEGGYDSSEGALASGDSYNELTGENYSDVLNANVASAAEEGQQGSNLLASGDMGGEDAMTNPYTTDSSGGMEGENLYSGDYTTDGSVDSAGADLSADAAVQPAGGGLPEMGSKMSYIVERGDTLAIIAEKVYGDREQWREIRQLTGMENPHLIYPGEVVYYRLTEQSQAFAASYENTPKGEVTVQAGDTLAALAQRIYGDSNQWKTLWRANDAIDNPDRLNVGQIVYFINSAEVMAQINTWEKHFQNRSSWPHTLSSQRERGFAPQDEAQLSDYAASIISDQALMPWI